MGEAGSWLTTALKLWTPCCGVVVIDDEDPSGVVFADSVRPYGPISHAGYGMAVADAATPRDMLVENIASGEIERMGFVTQHCRQHTRHAREEPAVQLTHTRHFDDTM